MKEKLIKEIQKFLNAPFKYASLIAFLDKQKDFLLQKNVLDKTDEAEYNALWDAILDLEKFFSYANDPMLTIGAEISVLRVFDSNLKNRLATFQS